MTLHRLKKTAGDYLPDAVIVAGAIAVSIGAGAIYSPAGWIVGGLLAIAGGVLLARDGA